MPTSGIGEVAEQLRRSTVQVRAGRRAQGSGVVVKPEGVIVTNAHVLDGAGGGALEIEAWDGRRTPAKLMLRDRARDLVLLQVPRTDLPPAPLGDSGRLRVGELVIAIGNPMGFVGALTTGVVHAVGRVRGLGPEPWIQADVRLAPGNSGGPLADASGRVIGVNTMVVGSRAGALGLAIPSNRVTRLLQGHEQPAQLGAAVRAVQVVVRSAYRPQPTRNTRLKSLATKTAVAALLITGSAGIVVAATSSLAYPAASASQPVQPNPCDGWIQVNQGGCVGSPY